MGLSLYSLFSWTIPFVFFTAEYRVGLNASRFLDNDTNSNIFYYNSPTYLLDGFVRPKLKDAAILERNKKCQEDMLA